MATVASLGMPDAVVRFVGRGATAARAPRQPVHAAAQTAIVATGVVSVHSGVGLDEALMLLRARAYADRRPIAEVAQDVLSGEMTPGRLGQFVLYSVIAASSLGQLSEVWGELSAAGGAAALR